MKTVAVLLNGEIKNDSRVIKTVKTISTVAVVHLFYINGNESDKDIFLDNDNVRIFSIKRDLNFSVQLQRHLFFQNEFLFFIDEVLKTGIKYDYIYANDLPCLKPAAKIKNKLGTKLIYDSHEIYTETMNQFFPDNKKGFKKLIFKFLLNRMRRTGVKVEKKYLKDTDYFITVGYGLKSYFEDKYGVKNVKVMMNCPPIHKNITPVDLKKMLNIPESSFLIIYQGCLNKGRGLELMIKSFKNVNENIFLVIIGNGALKPELLNLTDKLQLKGKVFFMEAVDSEILLNYTAGADTGINLLESFNLSKEMAVPNKLFEYIQSGLPIISSKTSEMQTFYSKYNLGVMVNNTEEDVSEAINYISEADLSEYKENCKAASLEYNWENQEKVLFEILNN